MKNVDDYIKEKSKREPKFGERYKINKKGIKEVIKIYKDVERVENRKIHGKTILKSFRLEKSMSDSLKNLAVELGRPQAYVIKAALKKYIQKWIAYEKELKELDNE